MIIKYKKGMHPSSRNGFKKGEKCKNWNGIKKGDKKFGGAYEFPKGNQINKGRTPWNKGIKQWENNKHPMLGEKHTKESQMKMSKGLRKAWKEGKFGEERNKKLSEANKGEKNWNYIDGRSKLQSPGMYGDDWSKIRLLVYKRDNFTCQECGITMNKTRRAHHIHHIIPFLISFDNSLNNLITLCPYCHRQIETKILRKLKQIKMEGIKR